MRKVLHTIAILFLLPLSIVSINAQETAQRTKCQSHEIMKRQIAEHPEMAQEMANIERQTAQFSKENSLQMRGGQITIPVVVHVVYRTESENISVAQIQSQIEALNRDYNKQNLDATKIPTEFSNIAADCQIRFKLASRDPQANPTSGIVRHATTKANWGASDDIKKITKGGFANWDPSKYLNIYVANIGDGVLGYASFPSSPAYLDGVVIDYTVFGTEGTARVPFNKGRTCVHEIGHWMNLAHTWGDSDCGDDYVNDTPQQKDAHYGNVTTPQFSYCTGKATRDMAMNYMDYVNDECMFMFSAGQKTRIQAIFATKRASILNSDGCAETKPTTCDLGKPTIKDIKTTSVNITWTEILGMKNYTVAYRMNGLTDWTVTQTSKLSLAINGLIGGATYECRIKGDCGESGYSETTTFKTPTALQTKAAENNSFGIYPNPVVHDVNIMFNVLNEGMVSVQIYDSNGVLKTQIAKNITKTTPAVSFDLTEFPSGMYLVVAEQDGKRVVKKLLKVND